MASEIRVNRLSNRSGLSTITFANGGVQFSGITTFANGDFRVGTGATILNPSTNEMQFHTGGSNRLTINNAGLNLGIGSITVGDATFTGSVSIGKTLTYEDVKNVDSIGIVTARTGVKITGGDFTVGTAITASSVTGNVTQDVGITTYSGSAVWFKGATANKDMYWSHASGATVYKDNAQILMGDNSDLQIYHNGSHSYITEGSGSTPGDLHIQANNLKLRNWDGGQNYFTGTSSGSVELFHDGNKKFETVSAGVNIPANNLTIDANNGEKISLKGTANPYIRWYESSTAKAYIQWNSAGYLHIQNEEASKFIKIDSSGASISGILAVSGSTSETSTFTGNGVQISHASGSTIFIGTQSGTDAKIQVTNNAPLHFRTNNTERLRITAAGKVLINNTASNTMWGYGQAGLQLTGNWDEASASFINDEANANSHAITLAKIRGSSIVNSGDTCGAIAWNGYDGSAYKPTARIMGIVDGTPGSGDMPGRLVFETTNDGGSTPVERMRLNSSGRLMLGPDAVDIQIIPHSTASGHGQIYLRGNASNESSSIKLNHYGHADYVIGVGRYSSVNGIFSITRTDAGTDGLLMNNSGRVAIGKAPETLTGKGVNAKLQVKTGSTDGYDGILIGDGYNRATLSVGAAYDLVLTSNAYPANATTDGIRFRCGSSGGGGPNERMRIQQWGGLDIHQYWSGTGTGSNVAAYRYLWTFAANGTYSTCTIDFGFSQYGGVNVEFMIGGYNNRRMHYTWQGYNYSGNMIGSGGAIQSGNGPQIAMQNVSSYGSYGTKGRLYCSSMSMTHPSVRLDITSGMATCEITAVTFA